MKAYIAKDLHGGHGGRVVFADTPGRARTIAHGEFGGWVEWLDIGVRRAPEYDKYADAGKVPKEVLLADGWYWECGDCYNPTYEESAVIINDTVYCTNCRGV